MTLYGLWHGRSGIVEAWLEVKFLCFVYGMEGSEDHEPGFLSQIKGKGLLQSASKVDHSSHSTNVILRIGLQACRSGSQE